MPSRQTRLRAAPAGQRIVATFSAETLPGRNPTAALACEAKIFSNCDGPRESSSWQGFEVVPTACCRPVEADVEDELVRCLIGRLQEVDVWEETVQKLAGWKVRAESSGGRCPVAQPRSSLPVPPSRWRCSSAAWRPGWPPSTSTTTTATRHWRFGDQTLNPDRNGDGFRDEALIGPGQVSGSNRRQTLTLEGWKP